MVYHCVQLEGIRIFLYLLSKLKLFQGYLWYFSSDHEPSCTGKELREDLVRLRPRET